MKTHRFGTILFLAALAVGAALWMPGPTATQTAAAAGRSSAFRIVFGERVQRHGANWTGGFNRPGQIRSYLGWRLHDDDELKPPHGWNLELRTVAGDTPSKGVVFDVVTPETQPVSLYTRRGDIDFAPADIPYGEVFYPPWHDEDVAIDRVPYPRKISTAEYEDDSPALLRTRSGEYWAAWVGYKTRKRNGYFYDGADEVFVSRSRDGEVWSRPEALTKPGDHFRTALGEDSDGGVWCVYARQERLESGDFNLYGRRFDDGKWQPPVQLSDDANPDVFHSLATDSEGRLHLAWMGFRSLGAGERKQSDILYRRLDGGSWGPEVNVTRSTENDWEPSIAADSAGRAWIGWDSYSPSAGHPENYNISLISVDNNEPGQVRRIGETAMAEMRASVAVDGEDRVWIGWEENGVNWGKDTGYENPKHRIFLKQGGTRLYGRSEASRSPRIAVLAGGRMLQPAQALSDAFDDTFKPLFQSPKLGVDGDGRVWAVVRHQLIAQGRNGGHIFDNYATTLSGDSWLRPILLTGATGRQDTVRAIAPGAPGSIHFAVVGDGRQLPVGLPKHHDVFALTIEHSAGAAPRLVDYEASQAPAAAPTHATETEALTTIRDHRIEADGRRYQILRGDLHRHTEISMDGATDGSLWDLYRYAVDAAGFDFIGVTDHNYGSSLDTDEPEAPSTDDEFMWWRTQKSADIFHVPGRFVPLYGYERSVNFPLGHRNIFHARRGVFSYRVPRLNMQERSDLLEQDQQGMWAYLRQTDGLGIPHTSGTNMGTDWSLRDDEVIPVTEIYQGDRNAYEEEGAPRAALPDNHGLGFSGRKPYQKGLIWNALGVGYRMGFIASSDHYSTHISYTNLIVPEGELTRDDLQASMRARRTYASTDNIVVDFRANDALQGEEISARESPEFAVDVLGTEPIREIEIIKNNRVIFTWRPPADADDRSRASFTFRDLEQFDGFKNTSMSPTSQITNWDSPETGIRPRPEVKESYYYARVIQSYSAAEPAKDGEVAWSSPIFVRVLD